MSSSGGGEADLSMSPRLLQVLVFLGISAPIQGRRDGDDPLGGLSVEVLDHLLDGEASHLLGELDRVGVDLPFLDRLPSDLLTVEADDLDLILLSVSSTRSVAFAI